MRITDVDLRGKTWGQVKTTCPLCSASRKDKSDLCLSVNITEGKYNCHHCKAYGSFDGYSGTSYANSKPVKYEKPDPNILKEFQKELDPECIEYFKGRGISKETLIHWRISYGPSFPRKDEYGKTIRDSEGTPVILNGIRFPFFENKELVNVKHILPPEWSPNNKRYIRSFPGAKMVPFGLDHVSTKQLVIVEGEIDALSIYESGIDSVWSVPNGANSLQWLEHDSVVNGLLLPEVVYIAVDNDEAGSELREELIRRLSILIGVEKLRVVRWTLGKDANDTLVQGGKEAVKRAIIDEALPVPIDGISTADEFMTEYLDYYDNGMPRGVSTGFATVDPLYRIMPGMLTVITGVPSYGKSEWLDAMLYSMNDLYNWKFAYYTPENDPQSLHMIKLAEKYIGKPFDQNTFGHMTRDEALAAAAWINENIFYINPRGRAYSIDEIIERGKVLIYRHGVKGIVIDPWNYVRKDFGNLREDQYINQELQKLIVFAKTTGIHVWLVVHPRTLRRDKEGKIQTPTMYDLSGGSKFGDNTDFLLCVERNPKEAFETGKHKVTIHVQKARYRPAGQQGQVVLNWNPFNGRFSEDEQAVIGEFDSNGIVVEDDDEPAF